MRISELFEGDEPIRLKLGSGMKTIPMDGKVDDAEETPKVIKLGAKRTSTAAQRFMEELEASTEEHPFTRGMRYFTDGPVLVSIHPDDYHGDDVVVLDDIQSKARGAGAKAMRTICAIADASDVAILLYAKGYAHVPTEKLVEYYQRFGFEIDADHGEGVDMSRSPQ